MIKRNLSLFSYTKKLPKHFGGAALDTNFNLGKTTSIFGVKPLGQNGSMNYTSPDDSTMSSIGTPQNTSYSEKSGSGNNKAAGVLSTVSPFATALIDSNDKTNEVDAMGNLVQSESKWGTTAKGALQGAEAGAVLGAYGMVAGAAIGGAYGYFSNNSGNVADEQKRKAVDEKAGIQLRTANDRLTQLEGAGYQKQGNQYTKMFSYGGKIYKGVEMNYENDNKKGSPATKIGSKYKSYLTNGGEVNPEYEVEHNEVVQGDDTKLEGQNDIASDLTVADGERHENGGVKGEGGERVFSDRLKLSPEFAQMLKSQGIKTKDNITYAEIAKSLGNKKGKFEKNLESPDYFVTKTANAMVDRIDKNLDSVFQIQEVSKQIEEQNKFQKAYGGYLKKFANGGNWEDFGSKEVTPDNSPVRTANQNMTYSPRELALQKAEQEYPINNIKPDAKKQIIANVVGGISIKDYATNPNHEKLITDIYSGLEKSKVEDVASLNTYIKKKFPDSPLTADMIFNAAKKTGIDHKILTSILQGDSSLATTGLGGRQTKKDAQGKEYWSVNYNPGNLSAGTDKEGNIIMRTFDSWDEGVNEAAKWLAKHKATDMKRHALGGYLKKFDGGGTFDNWISQNPHFKGVSPEVQQSLFEKYNRTNASNGESRAEYKPNTPNFTPPEITGDPNAVDSDLTSFTSYRRPVNKTLTSNPEIVNRGATTMSKPDLSINPLQPYTGGNYVPPNYATPKEETPIVEAPIAENPINPVYNIIRNKGKGVMQRVSEFGNENKDQLMNLGVYINNRNEISKQKTNINRYTPEPTYTEAPNYLPQELASIDATTRGMNKSIDENSSNYQDSYSRRADIASRTIEGKNAATKTQSMLNYENQSRNAATSNQFKMLKASNLNEDAIDRVTGENKKGMLKTEAANTLLSGYMGNQASKRGYDVEKEKNRIAEMSAGRGALSTREKAMLHLNGSKDFKITKKDYEELKNSTSTSDRKIAKRFDDEGITFAKGGVINTKWKDTYSSNELVNLGIVNPNNKMAKGGKLKAMKSYC